MDNCPKCKAAINERSEQCSSCGIFFNKWKEREDQVAAGNFSRYQSIAQATSTEFNWTILFIVACAVASVFYFLSKTAE